MKITLCGLGKMGTNHYRILQQLPGCKLISIADPDLDRTTRMAREAGVKGFGTLVEALDDERPDAVIIAAPTRFHFELAREVLQRKIPLFLEKPITRVSREGQELCELAVAHGVPFMIGHVERFNPAVVAAYQLIRQDELGQVLHIGTRRVGGTPKDILGAGDVLVDLAVHDIDIVRWLTGKTPKLAGCLGHASQAIDSASLLFQCGEAVADVQVNWITPIKFREISITGTKGYLHANLISQEVTFTRQNNMLKVLDEKREFFFDDYIKSFSSPDRIELGIQKREPLREELLAFITAVKSGLPMPVTATDGLLALKLAEEARLRTENQLGVAAPAEPAVVAPKKSAKNR